MADDGFNVRIDDDLAEELRAAAAALGMPVETYVREALASRLRVAADQDWAEDYARVADYEATGRHIPAKLAMAEFRAALEARLAKK
jgi:post-segregation antitoxin (ccd killing protein)